MKIIDFIMGRNKKVKDEDNFVRTYINNAIHDYNREAMKRNLYAICDEIAQNTVEGEYSSFNYEFDTANEDIRNEVIGYLEGAGYKIEQPWDCKRIIRVLL